MCSIKSAIYLFSQGSLFGMQVLHISSTYEPLDIHYSIKLREGRVWMTFGESSETSRESNLISSIKEEKKNSKPEIHARRNCLTEKVRYTKGQLFVWLILRLLQSNFSRYGCEWQLKELPRRIGTTRERWLQYESFFVSWHKKALSDLISL